MVLGKLDIYMQKNEIGSLYIYLSLTKINLKWIKDLNVRPEIQTPRGKHHDICLCDHFLGITLKAHSIKTKINKQDYIKLKSFCTAIETINRMKRQPMG